MAVAKKRSAKQSVNIDDLTAEELVLLIARAHELLAVRKEETKAKLLAEMRVTAERAGLSLEDLLGDAPASGRRQRRDVGVKLKPKYIGPNGETYKGRGPTPKWLKDLERKGVNREKFRAKGT